MWLPTNVTACPPASARPVRAFRIWTLPRAERRAARFERRAEEEMRRQRDNVCTPEMRAAARDAEARRWPSGW
jgi:hypothetical protein